MKFVCAVDSGDETFAANVYVCLSCARVLRENVVNEISEWLGSLDTVPSARQGMGLRESRIVAEGTTKATLNQTDVPLWHKVEPKDGCKWSIEEISKTRYPIEQLLKKEQYEAMSNDVMTSIAASVATYLDDAVRKELEKDVTYLFDPPLFGIQPVEDPSKSIKLYLRIIRRESRRLHLDWLGQCRTCNHWGVRLGVYQRGNLEEHPCKCPESELSEKCTTSTGHCPKWESFDPETVSELKAEWDRGENPGE
jgi:hypothetical protein